MKVIQVPFCFYPDAVGGTEVYVEALAKCLKEMKVEVMVVAPGRTDATYAHEGLAVRRFAVSRDPIPLRELYGEGDALAMAAFDRILSEERPDLVHLHALTSSVSLRLVRRAKQRGIPIVFTYHTPTVSCQRGTLMRWGSQVCDGVLRLDLCTRCTLHGLGLPRMAAEGIGRVPVAVGRALGTAGLSGGMWTAFRMRELLHARHMAVRDFFREVDHIVAVCEWARQILLANGVSASKIALCRQGLVQEVGSISRIQDSELTSVRETLPSRPPIRIAFLGRLHPTKGVDGLIRAIRMEPKLSLTLDIYGVVQGIEEVIYRQQLQKLVSGDSRVIFHSPMDASRVVSHLRNYHLLAVPSQGLESGPLVILEAFAAGIPVMGSRLGGIAELVQHEVNGLLVEPGSVSAWRGVLRRICKEEGLLPRLRRGVSSPSAMASVADKMQALYERLCRGMHPLE